ncbi:hypothetical protein [Mycobacterium sp. 141]|uniref:hypothetical protein n=1 Tax=Mycobacterium sp. 141 TaxID=1120797 RepID=UPI0003748A78|nr:hypothetical protein [Mycobacterium sp. 141]
MSLDQIASQIAKLRKQAAGIQEEWSRRLKAVGGDSKLTDEGKRDELDREFAELKKEIVVLREKEKGLVRDKKESLERALFGLVGSDPNKIIAWRDAQDRAARVQDRAGALRVYNSAQISSDDSLAKAILAKAVAYGYREIIDDYARRHPIWREELDDLAGIQAYDSDGTRKLQITLAYALVRGVDTGIASNGFIDFGEHVPPLSDF